MQLVEWFIQFMEQVLVNPDVVVSHPKSEQNSAIAIIGIGCRLPGGVHDAESYWKFLCSKKSGITLVPEDRWYADKFYDKHKEKLASSVSKWAGFVDDIKSFDAKAFGISPREAAAMDPQQRILLESARDAVEDASIPIANFHNSKTGVFVGISQSDYKLIQEMRLTNSEIFAGTGYALCINANRISHRFGLTGPSYAVDTACSSSLVALDQACLNINSGACDMALACGVNILAHPVPFVVFSKAGMLSDTGVLSTFDSNANGYVRGEGVGSVLLKKLDAALEDGDEIYAVIEGTSVNQDGYTTTLTAPNQGAQISMLESLCEKTGVEADQIGFVEAHGTGTPVGDPIEAGAIGEAIGKKRSGGPVYVGSVKANIGHLESAAGISGLIKAALAIKYGKIPPNINYKKANPNIPMDVLNIQVPTSVTEFPTQDDRRYAVVNSFGFGGTNASALLSSAPETSQANSELLAVSDSETAEKPIESNCTVCVISSHDQQSLQAIAQSLVTQLSKNESLRSSDLNTISAAISERYSGGNIRGAVVANSSKELIKGLRQIAKNKISDNPKSTLPLVFTGDKKPSQKVAFVFTGQGSQWWAMARDFITTNEVFASAVDEFDGHFQNYAGWSIKEELLKPEAESRINDTTVTQPALFAIQVGLAAVWEENGLTPDMVLGHSIGEAAAMYVAGGLSMESAAKFLNKRGAIRDQLNARGSMAAVAMEAAEVDILLDDEPNLCVAAINAPGSTTITGDNDAIDAFIVRFENEYPGIFIRKLNVDTAWHSHHLDNGQDWFHRNMDELDWSTPSLPFVSTVTGKPETCFDKAYGWENLRRPVNLKGGVETASELGANVFVEIGPHSTLVGPIGNTCAANSVSATILASLDRNLSDELSFAKARAIVAVNGIDVGERATPASHLLMRQLPSVPWNKESYWKDSEESRQMSNHRMLHPLLGMPIIGPTPLWKGEINLESNRYLEDHRLAAERLFPAAGYIEILLAAGRSVHGEVPIEIVDTAILEAMFIGNGDEIVIFTTWDVDTNMCRIFSHVRDSGEGEWTLRAHSIVRPCQTKKPERYVFKKSQKGQKKIPLSALYDVDEVQDFVNYGPAFKTVTDMWMTDSRTSAKIKMTEGIADDFDKHVAHPALIDGCLQITDPRMTLDAISKERSAEDPTYLPVGARSIRLFRPVPEDIYVHSEQLDPEKSGEAQGGFIVTDSKGDPVMQVIGLQNRRLPGKKENPQGEGGSASTVIEEIVPIKLPTAPLKSSKVEGLWLVLSDDKVLSAYLKNFLAKRNCKANILRRSDIDDMPTHWIANHLDSAFETGRLRGIVYGWGTGDFAARKNISTKKLVSSVEENVHDMIWFAQALDEFRDREKLPGIFVLTHNARPDGPSNKFGLNSLINAPQVAVARTIGSEYQEFPLKQVDLDDTASNIPALEDILFGDLKETELLIRGDTVLAPRLKSVTAEELPERRKTVSREDSQTNFQISMAAPGVLDNLDIFEVAMPGLAKGEVQLEVATVGLNFRDIMAAAGLLPTEAEPIPAWTTLGLEFGAVVTKLGAGVKGLKVGDNVMGMAKSCLTRYVSLPASTVTKIPKHLSLADAATIPSAFATAYYALNRVGNLRKGEKILIHVATGGVGLAAVQIAKLIGAEIFATAGSVEKRRYLKKLGIKHVMNSRSLDFADEIHSITNGEGVDVILNSLPDAYIQKGLDILAPYGRFLEIGKRDVYVNSAVGMKALRRNVSFCVLDLAAMGSERPDLMGDIFSELVSYFRKGQLQPLPSTTFKTDEIADAFKYMSQAKHIGKVIVDFNQSEFLVLEDRKKQFRLHARGTYMVTGGSRGFGITVANWLSRSGAGKVLLASRSGTVDAEYKTILNEMRNRGTKVVSAAVDITDEASLAQLIEKHHTPKNPVKGVIHSAAVIEDALLTQLDSDLINRVIRPKVAGAWNIYRVLKTAKIKTDFFVNFSSVAQLFGSAGQANYVAANAFLDGMAHFLKDSDLNCRTIDWGVLGESGFVTRNDSLESYLDSVGMGGITDEQACGALEMSIRSNAPSLLYAAMDWEKLARANPVLGQSPRLLPLLQKSDGKSSRLKLELIGMDLEARTERLGEFICAKLSNVLKVEPNQIPYERPMTELGLDSLSAFELKNRIEGELDMTIPISKFLRAPTIVELSTVVSSEIEKLAAIERQKANDQKSGKTGGVSSNLDTGGMILSDRQEKQIAASLGRLTSNSGRQSFINSVALRVNDEVQESAVQSAMSKIAKRHRGILAQVNMNDDQSDQLVTYSRKSAKIQEWTSNSQSPEVNIEAGELFAVEIKPFENSTDIRLSAHSAVFDRWSLHAIAEELLLVLSGEKLPSMTRKSKYASLIDARSFDMDNPIASGHRSFWHYASQPLVESVAIAGRRRPIANVLEGTDPGHPHAYDVDLRLTKSAKPTIAKLLNCHVRSLGEALGKTLHYSGPLLINAKLENREAGSDVGTAVGAFDGEYPILLQNHAAHSNQLVRIVNSMDDHLAFDMYSFADQFADEVERKRAALSQFTLSIRMEGDAHPLELMLNRGSASIGAFTVEKLETSQPPIRSDIQLELVVSEDAVQAKLICDSKVIGEETAWALVGNIAGSRNLVAAE